MKICSLFYAHSGKINKSEAFKSIIIIKQKTIKYIKLMIFKFVVLLE